MPKVNVSGLPIERVIIALYQNAYLNSEASRSAWLRIADRAYYQHIPVPVGTDRPPTEFQVREMMGPRNKHYRAQFIDYVGPVKISVAFDNDYFQHGLLDLDYYDREHRKPYAEQRAPVKSAEACVADLRKTLKIEAIRQQELYRQHEALRNEWEPRVTHEKCEQVSDDTLVCPGNSILETTRVISKKPGVTESFSELQDEQYTQCQVIRDRYTHQICQGEKTTLTEKYNKPRLYMPEPQSTSSMLFSAALYSAGTAALSEAVGDAFYLTGLASEVNTAHIKKATQLMMIYLSGSVVSASAAWCTSKLLQKTGMVSESRASHLGAAVGIGINVGKSLLTPTGAAITVVSLASSQLGLFAEKKAVEAIIKHNIERGPALH